MTPTMTFDFFKTAFQSLSLIVSVLVNSLLILLILTKSTKNMGNYRYLMIFFCCFSIVFSFLDIIVRPVMYSHKCSFFMFMDLRNRMFPPESGVFLICSLAGCFGVIIYGIAIHFIYRYLALERHGRIRYFDKKYLPLWFTIPFIGGLFWTLASIHLLPMTPTTSDFIRPILAERFGIDLDDVTYTGALFYVRNGDGARMFNWKCGVGLFCYMLIMTIPFSIVVFVSAKSYGKIKKFPMSKYGKHLQVQLYKALVAQTLIPVLLLFLPFSVIFLCPMFEVECARLTTSLTFVYALYPTIDPLPILFFVENYRNAILGCCRLCRKTQVHAMREEEEEEEASRNGEPSSI